MCDISATGRSTLLGPVIVPVASKQSVNARRTSRSLTPGYRKVGHRRTCNARPRRKTRAGPYSRNICGRRGRASKRQPSGFIDRQVVSRMKAGAAQKPESEIGQPKQIGSDRAASFIVGDYGVG